jgi:DNA polymerase III subunit gamma/tau
MQFTLKYQPQKFKEIFGHAKTKADLVNRSINNNFPKVMIFTGITGVGKTVFQNIIAKAMLCDNKENGEPCNQCYYCKAINEDKPLENVFQYNGSNLGIDEARLILEKASVHLISKKDFKIFIIDEMQEIPNSRAQKNILKVLERKGDNCFFILGTMNRAKIDSAILNRAINYNLTLDYTEIRDYLVHIVEQEKINIEDNPNLPDLVVTIVDNCEGSLRTAVSMLERVLTSGIMTSEELFKELGILADTNINKILKGLLFSDITNIDFSINENVLEAINKKLIILYKYTCGLELNVYEKSMIKMIGRVSKDIVENTIMGLSALNNYVYLKPETIMFHFIKTLSGNKKLKG